MGLSFSHCDAYWAYSSFYSFKLRLLAQLGIHIINDGNKDTWDDAEVQKLNNPIKYFISHSDCDGVLSPEQCKAIAPQLRELVKDLPEDDHDKFQALLLADGIEQAGNDNDPLEFR